MLRNVTGSYSSPSLLRMESRYVARYSSRWSTDNCGLPSFCLSSQDIIEID
ncbi:hypothetical protein DPMN_146961 [Dreissena polymorpha]|uniref:Uncharacterized protein n=1 Tax=Dreissena polymorpha TaxID=45954 RepID=A0A9D4FBB6_DREPO|nr:hypothetical protein DPMN_146961 [Dreissena polymorpha]